MNRRPRNGIVAELERLRGLALRDELTGLANRRAFMERLDQDVTRAAAGGPAMSLTLLDLDGLKDINDTFGYRAGDRALQLLGAALEAAVGPDGMVARIGGDEFAVLVRHDDPAHAERVLEHVRRIAGGLRGSVAERVPDVMLRASIGHGRASAAKDAVESLFAYAEAELVTAKAAPVVGVAESELGLFRPRGRRALGEELRALLEMARTVTTTHDMDDLLHRAAEQAASLIGARLAAIALVDGDGSVGFTEAWRDGQWQPMISRRPLGKGVLGRTAVSGKAEMHATAAESLHYDHATVDALNVTSIMTVPLRNRAGQTFGVLALGNKRGGQGFQEGDVALAQSFANLAASVMENARLYVTTEEARAYQRALTEQAHDAIMVVDPQSSRLLDVNPATERLTGFTRDELMELTVADLELSAGGFRAPSGEVMGLTQAAELRRKDGARIPVELSTSRVATSRGDRVLAIVRDLRERLAAEKETRRRTAELEARNEVAALLAGAHSVDVALAEALPIITRAGEMDGALVLLADDEDLLQFVAGFEVPEPLATVLKESPARLGERLTGGAAAARTPVIITDVQGDPRLVWQATRDSGLRAIAIFPLVVEERVLGVFGAGTFADEVLNDERVARLRAFADQLAVWINGRRLLEEATARAQDARLLAEIGESLSRARDESEVLALLAGGVAAWCGGAVAVLRRNPQMEEWQAAAMAHPDAAVAEEIGAALAQVVAPGAEPRSRGGGPRLIDVVRLEADPDLPRIADARRLGLHTLLTVPLVQGDETLALLAVAHGGAEPRLMPRHLSLAQQIAQHAAVAVAKARASHEAHRTMERLTAEAERARLLLDLASELGQADGLHAVMRTALDACRRLALVGRAGICLWDAEERVFRFGEGAGLAPQELAQLRTLTLDPRELPTVARLVESIEPLVVEDAAADPAGTPDIAALMDTHAAAAIPMRAGGELLGFLSVTPEDRRRPFSVHEVELLTGIAGQTATALAGALARRRVEEARDYLQAVMQEAGDGIVVADLANGRIVDVNDQICRMLGAPRTELVGKRVTAITVPGERRQLAATLRTMHGQGYVPPPLRRTLRWRNGAPIPTEISSRRVIVSGRELMVGVVRDLRGRIEAERRLQFQSQVLSSMADAVVAVDRAGKMLFWNQGAERLFGLTAEQMMGTLLPQRLDRAGQELALRLASGLRTASVVEGDVPLTRPDGVKVTGHVTLTRLRDEHGHAIGTIGLVRDATAQRETESRLRTFAEIVRNTGESVVVVDMDGIINYANAAAHTMMRCEPGALIGTSRLAFLATDQDDPTVRNAIRDMLKGQFRGELGVRRADGTSAMLRGIVTPLLGEDGRPTAIVVVCEDVTEEHEARRAEQAMVRQLTDANAIAERRTAELRTIADLAGIIVTGEDPAAIFPAVARRILDAGTFDIVAISTYDPASQQLVMREIQHRLPEPPSALLLLLGRPRPRSSLTLLDRLLRDPRPLVMHRGDAVWQSSELARTQAHRERIGLVVITPLLHTGEFVGALSVYARDDREVPEDELRLLQAVSDQVAGAIRNVANVARVREMREDAIFRLAMVCEARDADTGKHLRSIQAITEALCRELGIPEPEVEEIGLAAVLHDIGKIAVPEAVLKKAGRLQPEEMAAIRLHTLRGEEMLAGPEFYRMARQTARSHHEQWDGSGYPDGLSGLAIPRPARIVAVADVFDALTMRRVYKPAWTVDDAAREILAGAGSHFDPEVAAALESLWRSGRLPATDHHGHVGQP